jgi:hypothetical protein
VDRIISAKLPARVGTALRIAVRAKFAVLFGEPTPSHNKVWLVKRIAWRLTRFALDLLCFSVLL